MQTIKSDQEILALLKGGHEAGVDALFRQYYEPVVSKIHQYIGDLQHAEDLAQELFSEIWNKRNQLEIQTSFKSYLIKSASNRAINFIKSKKLEWVEMPDWEEAEPADTDWKMEEANEEILQTLIDQAIEALPDRCRLVFCMSRFEEKTYAQIAGELAISIKTVENQMTRAFKLVREKVKELSYSA